MVASGPEGTSMLARFTAVKPGQGGGAGGLDRVPTTNLSVPLMCRMSLENLAI